MSKTRAALLKELPRELARREGNARAAKYDKATLSKWARMGGRPPKAKGKAT